MTAPLPSNRSGIPSTVRPLRTVLEDVPGHWLLVPCAQRGGWTSPSPASGSRAADGSGRPWQRVDAFPAHLDGLPGAPEAFSDAYAEIQPFTSPLSTPGPWPWTATARHIGMLTVYIPPQPTPSQPGVGSSPVPPSRGFDPLLTRSTISPTPPGPATPGLPIRVRWYAFDLFAVPGDTTASCDRHSIAHTSALIAIAEADHVADQTGDQAWAPRAESAEHTGSALALLSSNHPHAFRQAEQGAAWPANHVEDAHLAARGPVPPVTSEQHIIRAGPVMMPAPPSGALAVGRYWEWQWGRGIRARHTLRRQQRRQRWHAIMANALTFSLGVLLTIGCQRLLAILTSTPAGARAQVWWPAAWAHIWFFAAPTQPLAFASGAVLVVVLYLPVGAQSIFLLQQGMLGRQAFGVRRMVAAWVTASLCDSTLIVVGAAGVSAFLLRDPWMRLTLLCVGVGFLSASGITTLWSARPAPASAPAARDRVTTPSHPHSPHSPSVPGRHGSGRTRRGDRLPAARQSRAVGHIMLAAIAVSWGNAHAVLDTVAILGNAIALHATPTRLAFGGGILTGAWGYLGGQVLLGRLVGRWLTQRTERWIAVGSGVLMLGIAAILLWQAGAVLFGP